MTNKNSLILATVAMGIMILLYVLTMFGFMGDNPVGQTSSYEQPLVVPAGYAFSIWSIIYIGIIVFPIYQLIRQRKIHPKWQSIHFWYAINVLGNGLWLVFASYDWLWLSVLVISIMLWSLYKITTQIEQLKASGEAVHFWLEEVVFRIYFGWVTLATALNISAALNFYNWGGWSISQVTWSILVLTTAAFIAGYITWIRRDTFYGMVVIWAFIALIVRHYGEIPVLAYFSLGIVLTFILLILIRRPLTTSTEEVT